MRRAEFKLKLSSIAIAMTCDIVIFLVFLAQIGNYYL